MIKRPTLLIDENKCRKNIERMAAKAAESGAVFRPHFKTHQSLEIGRWFKDYGVDKITVSSVAMAEYFSAEWNDITIAFPVNILEIDEINSLSQRIRLNVLVESVESAEFLSKNIQHETGVFIKIDVGYHRTGISPENTSLIDRILSVLSGSAELKFKGFLSHAGHTYNCRTRAEVLEIHDNSLQIMETLKQKYRVGYPGIMISLGDTPSCSLADNFGSLDEMRPGNLVFFDLTQLQVGSCRAEDISVALACPVVAVHKDRNEIVIYGGGVHLSKERLTDDESGVIFGRAVIQKPDSWGDIIAGMYVKKLSQEHGTVHVPGDLISSYKPGDLLYILPVHSCMTANLIKSYRTFDGRIISRL